MGGVEALLVRAQLAFPRSHVLSPAAYNQIFTMHGTTMIFLVVMPVLTGFANYCVPLQIGARDVAFPRLNALAYWLFPMGGFVLHFSWLAGGAPDVGWFSYAPLSETPFTGIVRGADYWAMALLLLGISTIASSINLIATTLSLRAPGMTMRRVPLFVWMVFVNSILSVMALPALTASCVLLLADRLFGAQLFLPSGGGSAILWQHYFWSFGHPEVYIMVLPAFGMISEIVPVVLAQADLRICVRRGLHRGDRRPELRRLGAPHVHRGPRARGRRDLRRLEPPHRGADGREDLQLGRDDVGRVDPLTDRDAVRGRVPPPVRDRRPERRSPSRSPPSTGR